MPDGANHDVLIVVTTNNSVYAFDAQTYATLWHVNLGPPETDRPALCPAVRKIGIEGTPVIGPGAPGKQIIYVVAMVQPASGVHETQVRALDLGTGQDLKPAKTVTAAETLPDGLVVSYDPFIQYNRTGIALSNGYLYFGVGASCEEDAALTSGWVFRIAANFGSEQAFPLIEQQQSRYLLGGVWMSGFAPAIDGAGNVFVTTGNGSTTFNSPQNWSSTILKLSANLLTVRDHFTPANYAVLNAGDYDFGSGGVMLPPPLLAAGSTTPQKLAVTMGKDPVIYLLSQNALGGFSSTNSGARQALRVGSGTNSGVWGGPAFYNGPAGPTVYYQIKNDVLKAYHLSLSATPSLSLAAQGVAPVIPDSASPTVSSNGSVAGTGIVWVVKRTTPVTLEAYDAVKLGAPIYRSSAGKPVAVGQSAMVANGRVYVTGFGSSGIYVFGLVN